MKKTVSKLWQRWQRFGESTDEIPFIVKLLLGVLIVVTVAVFVSKSAADCLQQLLSEKYDVLKVIGYCVAGVVSIWLAWAANKRAKAMEDTAKEQAKATANTEAGQRQERLKNAIEHLGHGSDSVRMGGAYELFHLAKDTEDKDLRQTVMDILCAHIRQTTGENDYQVKHETKPSEEIQSLLTLLFTQKYNVFEDCSINLQSSYLNGATLSQTRLKGANLMEAQLQETNLRQAQLRKADLFKAQLRKADLFKAQLQGASLFDAQLQGANLMGARLQGASLSLAELQGAFLSEAELQGASLSSTDLQGAHLSGAELQGANLREAQLQEADLLEAQLQGANLFKAQLQGANLLEAQLQGANLFKAQLQKADLSEAELQGANLREAQLQGANLFKVQLQGANLMEAKLQGAVLYKAKLQGTSNLDADRLPSVGFESRMINRIGKDSDLTGIIFAGGLQEKDLDFLCRGLSDEKAQALREKLISHVGQPVSNELPKNSGAIIGTYTQEEAEQWIAEYQEAMREVPKRDDS